VIAHHARTGKSNLRVDDIGHVKRITIDDRSQEISHPACLILQREREMLTGVKGIESIAITEIVEALPCIRVPVYGTSSSLACTHIRNGMFRTLGNK